MIHGLSLCSVLHTACTNKSGPVDVVRAARPLAGITVDATCAVGTRAQVSRAVPDPDREAVQVFEPHRGWVQHLAALLDDAPMMSKCFAVGQVALSSSFA